MDIWCNKVNHMVADSTCIPLIDVLSKGSWQGLKSQKDPKLQQLADGLVSSALRGKAPSTTMKYLGGFRRWKSWALAHNLRVFPSNELHVALYLQHLGETKSSKAAIEEAVNSLAWAHSLSGLPSPTKAPFVQVVQEGLKRSFARPVKKKEPFTVEMLRAIATDATEANSLADIRLAAACLLAFAGFLRYDEVSNIRPCDVKFDADHISISIPRSKSDQLCQGDQVVIARLKSVTCPVAMLERYMCVAKIPAESKLFLFRPIVAGRIPRLRDSGKLSRTRLTELLREKLTLLGYPAVEFSPHSLRAGGATAAADAGVPDRIFKRHGHWKSETAKDGYVKDSLEKRLSVSKSLGL